ncbi:hypothetical protein P5V15_011471 [Pogonomyrmex californicus]
MANFLKNTEGIIVKDLVSFISEHTLNTFCETAMGTSLQRLNSFQQQYRSAVKQMSEILTYNYGYMYNDWVFLLTLKNRQQIKNSKDIAWIYSEKDYLSDSEEIDTFLFAGHDITAMTICFVLLLLAEYKDVQDHVREEVNAVMNESGKKLTMQSLENLSYLERCIKETLRVYPVVYFISRITSKDVMIAPLVYKFYLKSMEYLKDIQFKAEMLILSHPLRLKFIPIIKTYTDDNIKSNDKKHKVCINCHGYFSARMGSFQQQYRNVVQQMSEIVTCGIARPWLYNDWVFSFTKLYHEQTNGRYLKISDKNIIKKKRLAMMDLLITASREDYLTDSNIQEEIDTFLFAGHDTPAMTICFVLLAEHKDVQLLQNLSYFERCIKETLRLYPVVYFISRVISKDVKLHPETFEPDRFLLENIRNRHPYSYLPFSAGPRQRFALLKLKAMIAPLIYKFLEPVEYLKDIQFKAEMLIRPSHPLRLKFIPIIKTCTDVENDMNS